jgi:hypothetical protein
MRIKCFIDEIVKFEFDNFFNDSTCTQNKFGEETKEALRSMTRGRIDDDDDGKLAYVSGCGQLSQKYVKFVL